MALCALTATGRPQEWVDPSLSGAKWDTGRDLEGSPRLLLGAL